MSKTRATAADQVRILVELGMRPDLAGVWVECNATLRGAIRCRDLYRKERKEADDLRLALAALSAVAEDVWCTIDDEYPVTAKELYTAFNEADAVLYGENLARARQAKGGGDG